MAEGALRGTRLGTSSFETDENVILAPRQTIVYDCPNGHVLAVPMSLEAEVPTSWDCHCGSQALQRDVARPEAKAGKHVRTHWDMLLERRSIEELEVLLAERLEIMRGRPVEFGDVRKSA
ncbi:MAG: hypothetical protein QG597_2730 [Actinomycetota bacterium]|nr:hypothetical protein [Actinomycetota bacterium]